MSGALAPEPPGKRLAIVTTHPIQYYAPWFRHIALQPQIELKVFYLWDTQQHAKHDPGFGRKVEWDVPLLDGYCHEFVPNTSARPGTDRFWGIRNPQLESRIRQFSPEAALLIGYRHDSLVRLIFGSLRRRGFPLLFRGDSHRLGMGRCAKWKVEIRRWMISRIYRRFAAFLYVGTANREYFRMHGVPEERLFFAPHAVDNARFASGVAEARAAGIQWRRELGVPEDHLLVLFAGKFEEKKRPLDLLTAFRRLGHADVSLLLVGNGELEQQLRTAAAEMPNVFFAPFQNQRAMPRTYAACDLFVLPSYGPEESWGLAVNEALCLSRPVIVSSHVGCAADLVRSRGNGLVFPAGDIPALMAALSDALGDPERLAAWGERGGEMVAEYDYAHATAGLKRALEFIAARRPSLG